MTYFAVKRFPNMKPIVRWHTLNKLTVKFWDGIFVWFQMMEIFVMKVFFMVIFRNTFLYNWWFTLFSQCNCFSMKVKAYRGLRLTTIFCKYNFLESLNWIFVQLCSFLSDIFCSWLRRALSRRIKTGQLQFWLCRKQVKCEVVVQKTSQDARLRSMRDI